MDTHGRFDTCKESTRVCGFDPELICLLPCMAAIERHGGPFFVCDS